MAMLRQSNANVMVVASLLSASANAHSADDGDCDGDGDGDDVGSIEQTMCRRYSNEAALWYDCH